MNFLSMTDLSRKDLDQVLKQTEKIKKSPGRFADRLKNRTLLTFFEQPSLRTRVSFETGMTQLGGHGIFYQLGESTIGKKETYEDFASVVSRYCDAIAMRVAEHETVERVAAAASVPVINMMTNREHPCQILADLFTIQERFGSFDVKLAYLGDGDNNVTNSLLLGAAMAGMDISVASPKGYEPHEDVVKEAKKLAKSEIVVTDDAKEAAADADIIYTDSWMSYRIPKEKEKERVSALMPYQVNKILSLEARKDFVFMHPLPAKRDHEVTGDVMDGESSIVYDQAENRLHAQKALLLRLLK